MLPDTGALLESVANDTGLGDWGDSGDPGFADRVGLLLENVQERGLGEEAEQRAEEVFRWLLATRLRLFADRVRYGTGAERIAGPLIAIGEPRAGTTLLHALFSADPANRPVRFWELYYPSPPPGVGIGNQERMARADEDWREIMALIPKWMISHPYNDMLGQGPAECERFWAIDFRSAPPSAWWRVPANNLGAGLAQDPVRQYEIHKMTLQHLQYGAPGRRWALKGVFHQTRVGALLDAYPDGHFVWVHRDPVITTASFVQHMSEILQGISGQPVDRQALAADFVAGIRGRIRQVMADPHTDDPRILHVAYHEFAADHVAAVAGVYSHFGLSFGEESAAVMKQWLTENRADRYGKFTYSMDVLAGQVEGLDEEFGPYMQRFGVRREKR